MLTPDTKEFWIKVKEEYNRRHNVLIKTDVLICYSSWTFKNAWGKFTGNKDLTKGHNKYIVLNAKRFVDLYYQESTFIVDSYVLFIQTDLSRDKELSYKIRKDFIDYMIKTLS